MAESPITARAQDFAAWYQDVVLQGDMAEPAEIVKGCMVIKPNGYAVWEVLQRELDQRFKATGHQNVYFPLLIPQSFLRKEPAVRFHNQEDNPGDEPQHITQRRGDVILHRGRNRRRRDGRARRGPTLARDCRTTFRTELAFHWSATTLTERHETSRNTLPGIDLESQVRFS